MNCVICKKSIEKGIVRYFDEELFNGPNYYDENNEHGFDFCLECWEKGKEIRELLKELEIDYNKRRREYVDRWRSL